LRALLTDQLVILGMSPYPEPKHAILGIETKCPIVKPDPAGPETADLFEVKRRVASVGLE